MRALCVGAGLLLLAGCNTIRPVEIRTEPPGAAILVDTVEVGTSPMTHPFDFADPEAQFKVEARKEGYVVNKKRVSQLRLEVDQEARGDELDFIVIELDEDESWTNTTPSLAANAWLELEVNPQLDQSQVWDLLVGTITKYYPELPSMDSEAGYIAAKEKVARFKRGPTATVGVRNQFFCSIASRTPLVYKIKIESQLDEGKGYQEFPRIFKTDEPLITELQKQLVLE